MTDIKPFSIPEPPGPLRRGAPWPTMDPHLVDQDPPDGEEDVDRLELFESRLVDEELRPDEAERARQVALEDGRVREFLGGERITDFGAALIKAKAEDELDLLRYHFFSCDTFRTVQVVFDRAKLEILEVTSPNGQPAPLAEEVEHAVSLAAAALAVDRGFVGQAIFVTRDDPADPLFRHRLADVRFGKPYERRPRLRALVDLCEERVLDKGEFRRAG
jgi:hypothetical protein